MENKKRKYYRVKIERIPPYSAVNGSYCYEEDIWAYSEKGAVNKVNKEHKNSYGRNYVLDVNEITKEDFRGDKFIKS
ncbi:hypothetical protein N5B56_01355 [Eubacterium sp. LFL-14]|uniref:Uncharacterized protein n=1 Tax=Eubacterium album TaxID=2978477 RepID=A0ABT2M012_9FIRM|nr:hypothetical protein [Eubacterium sp. LFL-14]MCT7397732.1 hypothetical protein [Eubacterium sp. LFL-14]